MKKSKEQQIKELLKKGFSRKQLHLCKNSKCYNTRRIGSAYCQECADKYNK